MRLPGWERRLLAVVGQAAHAPYVLGEHDCFRLICRTVEAITGVDRWPEFRGRYADKRGALVLIQQYGSTFDAAFTWFFGAAPLPAQQAELGDAVKFTGPDGEAHLGVCLGAYAVVPGPDALVSVPVAACACCWRVG